MTLDFRVYIYIYQFFIHPNCSRLRANKGVNSTHNAIHIRKRSSVQFNFFQFRNNLKSAPLSKIDANNFWSRSFYLLLFYACYSCKIDDGSARDESGRRCSSGSRIRIMNKFARENHTNRYWWLELFAIE